MQPALCTLNMKAAILLGLVVNETYIPIQVINKRRGIPREFTALKHYAATWMVFCITRTLFSIVIVNRESALHDSSTKFQCDYALVESIL